MRARLAVALPLLAALLAGCADDDGGGESRDEPPDVGLLGTEQADLRAPPMSACQRGAEAAGARFDVPEGTLRARIEGTFATGRVGLEVAREDGRRVGYAAGASPVVVTLEEGALSGARALDVWAFTCEGASETAVRVFATFRS